MIYQSNELMHYGVLGMKWGIRRSRINNDSVGRVKKNITKKINSAKVGFKLGVNTVGSSKKASPKTDKKKEKIKRNAEIGAVAVGAVIAVIGGRSIAKNIASNREARQAISNILRDNGSDPLVLTEALLSRGRR